MGLISIDQWDYPCRMLIQTEKNRPHDPTEQLTDPPLAKQQFYPLYR